MPHRDGQDDDELGFAEFDGDPGASDSGNRQPSGGASRANRSSFSRLDDNDLQFLELNRNATFVIRCRTCDSRTSVRAKQIGQDISCRDCHSTLKVPEPTRFEVRSMREIAELEASSAHLTGGDGSDANGRNAGADDENDDVDDMELELLLGPEVEDSRTVHDFLFQEADGDEVSLVDDLDGDDLDDIGLEGIDDLSMAGEDSQAMAEDDAVADVLFDDEGTGQRQSKKDGNELPDDVAVKRVPAIDPFQSPSAQRAKKKRARSQSDAVTFKKKATHPCPQENFDSIFNAAAKMVCGPGLLPFALASAALMGVGNLIALFAIRSQMAIESPTITQQVTCGAMRFGVGFLVFGLATIAMWYLAGVVFLAAAKGKQKVDSLRPGPTSEWMSTWLLVSFSFLIAGLPFVAAMSIWLTAPLRLMIALPFLVSVWFTQSPFTILSGDMFSDLRRRPAAWKTAYSVVAALAAIAFMGGLLLHVPVPYLSVLLSLVGSAMIVFTHLAVAAVAGWHSRRAVESLP